MSDPLDLPVRLAFDCSGQFKPLARVAVVGAGIAGSCVARALCQAGVDVDLYDRAQEAAQGASGNWVGAFHPHLTRGDSPLSKLTRLGFEHTLAELTDLTAMGLLSKGVDWDTPGHLQTFGHDQAERARSTLEILGFSSDRVQWSEPFEHLPSPNPGYFFPQGGWVKPPCWVQANLRACGDRLRIHWGAMIQDVSTLLASHDAVVLACAEQSLTLAPIDGALASTVKGQITRVELNSSMPKRLPCVLSGESYAISPPADNWIVLGATYERPALDLTPTAQADEYNIQRFKSTLPTWPLGAVLDHRCGVRFVWNDRLPAIGPVPGRPNLFMSTGFASRGLLWAALGGWIVRQYCTGYRVQSTLLDKIKPRASRPSKGHNAR